MARSSTWSRGKPRPSSSKGACFGEPRRTRSRGSYRQSDDAGAVSDESVMIERTRMVVSFVAEKDFNEEALKEVGAFMKRFKQRTRQDSVALVVDGEMYYL